MPRVLALLEEGAVSEPGKRLCRELTPVWTLAEVAGRLDELRELMALEATDPLPLVDFSDVRPLVARARVEGALLWPEELARIMANVQLARVLKAHLAGRFFPVEVPLLVRLGEALSVPEGLEEAIRQATGGEDSLKDSASVRLAEARARIRGVRSRLHEVLQKQMDGPLRHHLRDRLITLRNGRYVLPVRTDSKGAVAGILHDYSHSKATAFMEPLAVVDLNNDLAMLAKEERYEEEKVLAALTERVRWAADDLDAGQDGLAYLDLLAAKTALARRLGGRVPELDGQGRLDLKLAVHPLLAAGRSRRPVPIDIHFSPELRVLIISGPNAGGKTATLKTVGLLALMTQAGLPIPAAEGSRLPVFPEILAAIGDEQDIEGALSTFTARMGRTKEVLELAAKNSLVLLDEIGTGTDPAEGAALAMAVLDELLASGVYCLITTHYHLLKAYGFLKPGVENISLDFDPEGLEPTFRLSYGKPGVSHALETAVRVGLRPELVERARGYISDAERKSASLISELEQTLERLRAERGQVESIRQQAEATRERRDRELARLRQHKDELLLKERRRAEDIVSRAEREVRLIKRNLRERKLTETTRLRQLRRELDENLRVREQRRQVDRLRAGEGVLVASLGDRQGQLLDSPEGKERVAVLCGGLRMDLPIWDLKPAPGEKPPKSALKDGLVPPPRPAGGPAARDDGRRTKKCCFLSSQPAAREVNLIGMRVEEALSIVDKTLDLAVVGGISSINVIHGVGAGRLRAAIREYLRGHAQVKSFRPAEGRQAAAVTVVEVES
ncbi:MAG: Smr/MutS family protein [Pseudomonadota bacterium]